MQIPKKGSYILYSRRRNLFLSRVLYNATNQITQKYNAISHKGIDLVKEKNKVSDVMAHSEGIVVACKTGQVRNTNTTGDATYGNYVKLKHNNGMYTLYAHLKNVNVKKGEKVKQGDLLGEMGETGKAYGAHLHFEVRNEKDVRINPTPYIDADLPNNKEKISVLYQTYDSVKKKWLPNVENDSDYAGNLGNVVSGLTINLTQGSVTYRVHELNNKWLPIVKDREDYAGNLGKTIDGVQMQSDSCTLEYRVHLKGATWLSWVEKFDDTNDGYAGILGKEIDAVQIRVKK